MDLFRSLDNLPDWLHSGAVTIGNFDGVHRGHAKIIGRVREYAQRLNGPSIVFTFDPHPVRVLRPEVAPPPLTWTDRKADLLAALGIDAVIAYPTNQKLLLLEPEEFVDQILVDSLMANAVIEGPNFYFGKDRKGNVEVLRQLCQAKDIEFETVQPVSESDELVSSSRIRQEIAAGRIETANRMLTQPYRIRGMVTHGVGRGSQIGFPTANVDAIDTMLPSEGVYAGKARLVEKSYAAAIHIGPNPTFGENAKKVEAHLLDFSESIYGWTIELDFLVRLRDIRTFSSPDDLVQQLKVDVSRSRESIR